MKMEEIGISEGWWERWMKEIRDGVLDGIWKEFLGMRRFGGKWGDLDDGYENCIFWS